MEETRKERRATLERSSPTGHTLGNRTPLGLTGVTLMMTLRVAGLWLSKP